MRPEVLALLKASAFAILVLAVALVALEDRVDLPTPYPTGSSPINPGAFGTTRFVELLKDYGMGVVYVSNWTYLEARAGARSGILIVSPEEPYTDEEADAIARFLRVSGGILVVADETQVSNKVLERLGSKVRIRGVPLLDEFLDLYPRATFSIGDREIALRLDKASGLRNCEQPIGLAESYPPLGGPPEREPVGCLERIGNVTVLVLGDGSVLTNQALGLGGTYRELAKFVAVTIERFCGRGCVVYVESGRYSSSEGLFETLAGVEGTSYYAILNRVVLYLRRAREALSGNPLAGLEEELGAALFLLTLVAILAGLGGGEPERRAAPLRISWRGRDDFSRVYATLARSLTLLGCEPGEPTALTRCLEGLGYPRDRASGLARFMRVSGYVLGLGPLSYVPLWGLLVSRALRYAEELLGFLEERVQRERYG